MLNHLCLATSLELIRRGLSLWNRHLDREKKTLADVFKGIDADGSGDLTANELHKALVGLGIPHKQEAAEAVLDELDMDGDDSVSLAELSARLADYRRKRRTFVAKVFNQCFEYIHKSGHSATQIFSRVDTDGSGELDLLEFQESMRRMGQSLSPNQAFEIMAELDLDGSGTIGVSEFLDKLKQVREESENRMQRCKQLFSEFDSDRSGFLDEAEVACVAGKLGLSDMVSDPVFVKSMIHEMESMYSQNLKGSETADHSGTGEKKAHFCSFSIICKLTRCFGATVDVEEFTHWFMEIGVSYLDKPQYSRTVNLEAPSEEDVQHMFEHVDGDKSGAVDLVEVQDELQHLWPLMDTTGFRRGFNAADLDNSGQIDLKEFRHLITFIVWLNEHRHLVQDIEEAFADGVGEAEFYCGCMRLSFHCGDTDAKFLFEQQCQHLRLVSEATTHTSAQFEGIKMSFDQFISWAVRYACVALKGEVEVESPAEVRARQIAFMTKELENMAGEYGDVHMIDLVSVLTSKKTDFAHANIPAWKQALTKAVGAASECSSMLAAALKNSTERNEGFPNLSQRSRTAIVQMCTREEYFTGQNVITQDESDGRYFVLRRGVVEIHIDGVGKVGQMEWGMGFGEIGLLLNTKRTATIKCATPCELYVLERADYETVVSMLPREQRLGPLVLALDKFWELMTGPDGSRRESVDYKTYLKAHIRTLKTLTANSDVEDFDEDEERFVAQSDWSEDCARYGLKVTESLSKEQYYDAMYQLVELWSGEQQLSYATFLEWVFENICFHEGDHYRFHKVGNVEAVGDKFEKMREEARSFQEAQEAAAAEVLAAAEEARRLHVEQQKELAQQQADAEAQRRAQQVEAERLLRETDELAAEAAELTRRLEDLDAEEAELRRRLDSGELTAEEEAAVRARLDAIAGERLELKARLEDNQFQVKLASLNQRLSAIDVEEADLLRRLASGELTAEEEDAIRRRLEAITREREQLLQQHAEILAEQAQAAADAVDAKFALELAVIDSKLSALDEEQAELLRRLAEGGLSAEEEAAIRARLAHISTERASLLAQRYEVSVARATAQTEHEQARLAAQIAELQRRLDSNEGLSDEERSALQLQIKQLGFTAHLTELQHELSALGAEEAELLRRLAAGGLSADEEAEIGKRLSEIATERRQLMKDKLNVYKAEEELLNGMAGSAVLSTTDKERIRIRLKALLKLIESTMESLRNSDYSQGHDQDGDAQGTYELYRPITTHDMGELSHNKLSPAEVYLLRQQEREERRARRRIVSQQAAAIQVATSELTQGGSAQALARQQWLSKQTATAAREQQWMEFDASRLTPQQLAEWNHLRSMLRVSDSFGRGRALAWLGKVMREMNLRDQETRKHTLPNVMFDDATVLAPDGDQLVVAGLSDDTDDLDVTKSRGRRRRRQKLRRNRKGGRQSLGAQQSDREQRQPYKMGRSTTKARYTRGTGAVSAPPSMHNTMPFTGNHGQFGGTSTVRISLNAARREAAGNSSSSKSNNVVKCVAPQAIPSASQQQVGQGVINLPPLDTMTIPPKIVKSLALRTTLEFEHENSSTPQHKSAPAALARIRGARGLEPLPWEAAVFQLNATSRYNVKSGFKALH
eukprot:COSAG02_NODE_1306_length_13342_cov_5.305822_3_plen_1617_part_00